ncbi:type II toxin-antitoxin system VapC family toxin [Pararhizobium polonicum]|uniref:type II toxin-antitoxin system VapC family toxin n=1 Tax=Pararhizobium polonicum TaxID=1612624 RepID=UPI00083A145B|nr:type II toxin-antitoxin system VapC family toxin [Pararhizobium polonicum]
MIYVIDASVAMKWFVDEGDQAMAMEITRYEGRLVAPDVIFAEVANVLRRKIRLGQTTESQAKESLQILLRTFPDATPSADLLEDAFALSSQLDHSVYDVLYLVCALRKGDASLITADKKFAAKGANAGFGDTILSLEAAYARFETGQEDRNG